MDHAESHAWLCHCKHASQTHSHRCRYGLASSCSMQAVWTVQSLPLPCCHRDYATRQHQLHLNSQKTLSNSTCSAAISSVCPALLRHLKDDITASPISDGPSRSLSLPGACRVQGAIILGLAPRGGSRAKRILRAATALCNR